MRLQKWWDKDREKAWLKTSCAIDVHKTMSRLPGLANDFVNLY